MTAIYSSARGTWGQLESSWDSLQAKARGIYHKDDNEAREAIAFAESQIVSIAAGILAGGVGVELIRFRIAQIKNRGIAAEKNLSLLISKINQTLNKDWKIGASTASIFDQKRQSWSDIASEISALREEIIEHGAQAPWTSASSSTQYRSSVTPQSLALDELESATMDMSNLRR